MLDEWKRSALCAPLDPQVFFPDEEHVTDSESRYARGFCYKCPVQLDCLLFAVTNRHKDGIWGGLGGYERERLNKIDRLTPERLERESQKAIEHTQAVMNGDKPERPWQPEDECSRCGSRIRAGSWPEDKNGPNASCGNAATFNKGCRCDWCVAAKAILHQDNKGNGPDPDLHLG